MSPTNQREMSKPFICCIIGALMFTTTAKAAGLERVNSSDMTKLLANIRVIYDFEEAGAFVIRVFQTTDPGECGSTAEAQTCPHSQLWILVGWNGIGIREPILWRTERRIGWEVDELKHLGVDLNGFDRTTISGTVCEASPDVESGNVDPRDGGWWKTVPYKLEITKDDITISKKPGAEQRICRYL